MVTHRLRRFWEPQSRGPWDLFEELQRDFASLFNASTGSDRIRIWASEDSAVLEIDAPGVEPDGIDIAINNDLVSIELQPQAETADDQRKYHLRERSKSGFQQQVQMPFPLDAEKTEAVCERGVLRLSVHRREDSKPAKISVKSG